ncbi:MAG TPA: membrane protein insertase YidC [Myxococcota bacterium]|nr:membrane protein insertase YidC [Myxococcota bacterium]
MDRNFVLACTLSFAVLVGWMLLTGDARRVERPREQPSAAQDAADEPRDLAERPAASGAPVASASAVPLATDSPARRAEPAERTIVIETPLYRAELANRGAAITSWKLAEYRETPDADAPRVELAPDQLGARPLTQTHFPELGIGDLSERVFDVVEEDATAVAFEIRDAGITVRKSFRFDPDSYSFHLLMEIANDSAAPIAPRFQVDMPAYRKAASDFREQALAALEDGSRIQHPIESLGRSGFFQSITGRNAPLSHDYSGEIDWAGVQTTYFLSALVPDNRSQAQVRIAALDPGNAGITELSFAEIAIPPGRSFARELRGYIGPKEMERLAAFGGETVHAIDLGWSWVEPLTRFFSSVLGLLHSLVRNYGVAIILLTILVRVVTAPLTVKQMRSMERMRALAPKLKAIQAEHAGDRQKQSEVTMALYRSEGVNPLSGCLPMLLQFPVFIGLFYALRSTIQLRQAPFFGWIDDLSVPESLFEIPGVGLPVRVLPLVMGATMVIQQRITPMQADPAQAKMMMILMPIMMTVLFYQFPSGLVLYWMISNVLAIAHQLWIGRGMRAVKAS